MNNTKRISILLAVALALASCRGSLSVEAPAEQTFFPIFFMQDVNAEDTKSVNPADGGKLIEDDMRGKDFSIIGYSFPGRWSTERVQAKPNVFTATDSDAATDYVVSQTVTCNSEGTCSYTPIKHWVRGRNYTFFAYYPDNLFVKDASGADYTASSENAPYVQVDIPSPVGEKIDPASMFDVVTASVYNANNQIDYHVPLNFEHRLFCISAKVLNADEEPITIEGFSIQLHGIKHSSALIPLDETAEIIPQGSALYSRTITFDIRADPSDNLVIPRETYMTVCEPNRHILLIPQEKPTGSEVFEGSVTMTYSTASSSNATLGPESIEGLDAMDFQPGRKYYVSVVYSNNSISVSINDAGRWDDSDQNIIFE